MLSINKYLNTLMEGDILKQLRKIPANSVDITITSPPYNKATKSWGWLVKSPTYSHYDDEMPEDEYQAWQLRVLNALYRVTKPGGSLFYNHKHRWKHGELLHPFSWILKSKWAFRQEIVWDRRIAANIRGWRFYQVDERIYWLFKPVESIVGEEMESKHAKLSSIWRIPPAPRSDHHPAPFPLALPTRILYSMFDKEEGKVVLDPFCGTGTTLVAAKLLNHQHIGIDISPNYLEFSQQRLDNAESERVQLQSELDLHVVTESFQSRKQRGNTSWPLKPKLEEKTLFDFSLESDEEVIEAVSDDGPQI